MATGRATLLLALACARAPEGASTGGTLEARLAAADNPTARLLAILDDDGNGRLSRAEFDRAAHRGQRFSQWDVDHSDDLDEDELHRHLLEQSPLLPSYRDGAKGKERRGEQPEGSEEQPKGRPPAAGDG